MVENNVPPYLPSPGGTAEKGALHLQGRKTTFHRAGNLADPPL